MVRLDSGDLRAIALSFGFTAGVVLAAALACDIYLIALTSRPLLALDDAPVRQLAADLLPWSAAFTGIALAGAALALRVLRESAGLPARTQAGFRRQG